MAIITRRKADFPSIGTEDTPEYGVRVRNRGDDPEWGATHVALRVTRRFATHLDRVATVAFRDDRIPTERVKTLRRFAETVKAAAGPVVILPEAWVHAAETTADTVSKVEANGITYSANDMGASTNAHLRDARRDAWVRSDLDLSFPLSKITRADGLFQSPAGKWHLCERGQSACGNYYPDDDTPSITEINLAEAFGELDLCHSAHKRLKGYADRLAGARGVHTYYEE